MIGFIVIGILGVAVILVVVANSRWAARKGWVYNTHNPRPPGVGVPKLVDEIYQPSVEHVIEHEVSDRTKADRSESGDPGVPDRSGFRRPFEWYDSVSPSVSFLDISPAKAGGE